MRALHIKSNIIPKSPRYFLLSSVGLTDSELRAEPRFGQINELSASNILKYFKLSLTDDPGDHLTFEESGDEDTLRILSLKSIFGQYSIQRVGFMRYREYKVMKMLTILVLWVLRPTSKNF